MLSEQQLVTYLDDTLGAEERAALEEALAADPAEDLMVLVSQRRLDAALRAVLTDEETILRMKDAILAAAGAPSTHEIKTRVLEQTGSRGGRRSSAWHLAVVAGIVLLLLGVVFSGLRSRWGKTSAGTTNSTSTSAINTGATSISPTARAEERDFFAQPFAASSPWNTPLGDGARYEPIDPYAARASVLPVGVRLRMIVQAEPSQRLRPVYVDGAHVADAPLAEGIENAADEGNLLCVGKARERYAVELLAPRPGPAGGVTVNKIQKVDLQSSGFAPDGRGLGVYGGSAFGGVVRHGEWQHGIRHALAISYNRSGMNQRNAEGKAFVWPVSQVDPAASARFGSLGNIFVGTLLAIPPGKDVTQLGFGQEGPAVELARALQDYGAYVVESCDKQWIALQVSDAGLSAQEILPILERLARELQVVTNNTPATPGGGGKRR